MQRPTRAPRLLALALVFLSVPAWLAAQDGRVVIVLDGSNSMWGRLDGTEKIVVAREVLAGMLTELPPEMAVGLAAYGHRREKDCDDIEVLLPVGAHTRAALDDAIRRVQPRGMTPITAALQRVVEQLDQTAGPTHVVLVSDGKETCDGDPCALTRALRARDATLTVHVVGFDVTRDEGEETDLGQIDQALDALERGLEARDPYLVLLHVSPWFDPLREHPRHPLPPAVPGDHQLSP